MLIVHYRTYSDLARCLASVAPHVGSADEVVVVDFESDPAALKEAVTHFGGAVPVVTVPRADNLGFAAGVNLAAARTRAPYLLLLNPDAVFEGPVIRVLESRLAEHPTQASPTPASSTPTDCPTDCPAISRSDDRSEAGRHG